MTSRVNLSIQQILAAFALGGALTFAGFALGTHKVSTPAPAAADNNAPAALDTDATEITPHTGGKSDDLATTYRCKPAFVPVQVPVGKTVQTDGATYTVTKSKDSASRDSVAVSIKLPANVAAPTIIVNGADHNKAPKLFGNSKLQVSLDQGGTGEYSLVTGAYLKNYEYLGITDITICTIKK